MATVFAKTIDKNLPETTLRDEIKTLFLTATNNCEWLKKGDKVLIKPALNSSDSYPSTTHPGTLVAIAEVLQKRGAEVLIGDQSGIEHVLQDSTGILRGSSEICYEQSGMKTGSETKFVAFEQRGWDEGFVHFQSPKTQSWEDGFYVTKYINEVDHIINVPRLSTHGQGGVTLGFKNLVGLLREDSRWEFHSAGPFSGFAKSYMSGVNFELLQRNTDNFFEKIVEISLAIQSKLRLTFFTGTQAQLTMGPDRYIIKRGGLKLLEAYKAIPDSGLIFASTDPVSAEAFAIAYMIYLYRSAPMVDKVLQKLLMLFNGKAQDLEVTKISENRFIKHAVKLGLGNLDMNVEGEDIPDDIREHLANI